MKVIAFNGSPRKTWNTATLLEKVLEGASSQGAETELISKVFAPMFDSEKKAQRRRDVFSQDCAKAFEMDIRFTQ